MLSVNFLDKSEVLARKGDWKPKQGGKAEGNQQPTPAAAAV
jgi:hypothetical protein